MATEMLARSDATTVAARTLGKAMPRLCSDPATVVEIRTAEGRRIGFQAWRSRYDLGAQQAIGTIRFADTTPADGDGASAMATALQCAAFHLPYGGASAGVALPPGLSLGERDQVCAAFGRLFPDMVLTSRCGAALGSGTILTGWLAADLRTLWPGLPLPGRCPPGLFREDAVALGAAAAVARFHDRPGRWVLAGFDRPALHLARLLHAAGWQLVAASDGTAAIAGAHGIAPSELACAMGGAGTLAALVGERGMRRVAGVHQVAADLVVVAGTGGGALPATQTILELAPGLLSPEAEARLGGQGCRVIPDVVAGAGAAILAHLSWLQRRHRVAWTRAELRARLMKRFRDGLAAIEGTGHPSLRQSAVATALSFMDSLRSGSVQSL